MQQLSYTSENKNATSLLKLVLLSALLVGTLDIGAAFIDFFISTGRSPFQRVLKYIASGVMGSSAFDGGPAIALLGLLLHYIIASLFTIFFFIMYRHTSFMQKHRIVSSLLYGLFIWSVMNFIVLPMSRVPVRAPFELSKVLKSVIILGLVIGLPLSFLASRYLGKTSPAARE